MNQRVYRWSALALVLVGIGGFSSDAFAAAKDFIVEWGLESNSNLVISAALGMSFIYLGGVSFLATNFAWKLRQPMSGQVALRFPVALVGLSFFALVLFLGADYITQVAMGTEVVQCGARGTNSRVDENGDCFCKDGYTWRNRRNPLNFYCTELAGSQW